MVICFTGVMVEYELKQNIITEKDEYTEVCTTSTSLGIDETFTAIITFDDIASKKCNPLPLLYVVIFFNVFSSQT